MDRWFFETYNALNWGKFMVARFDGEDWAVRSEVDPNRGLIAGRGWDAAHLLVLDLQTGEGTMVRPGGCAHADLAKHRVWVCPMFEPFLEWLYEQVRDGAQLDALPRVVELAEAPMSMAGYRREGLAEKPVRWRRARVVESARALGRGARRLAETLGTKGWPRWGPRTPVPPGGGVVEVDEVPVAVVSDAEMGVITQRLLDELGFPYEDLRAFAADGSFPSEFARLVWFAVSPLGASLDSPRGPAGAAP